MKNKLLTLLIFSFCIYVFGQNAKQDSITDQYLKNGVYQHHYLSQEWRDYIDQAIEKDSTVALFWQLKALPLWKTGKYGAALNAYDKAVKLNPEQYLGRRGFLKCIFKKDYESAITDLTNAEKQFGYAYENDHSYRFYIALSQLQLNQFQDAETTLKNDVQKRLMKNGEDHIHFMDYFYLGVISYELKKYGEAIVYFDKALNFYTHFSDAKYYKGLCLLKLNQPENGKKLMLEAKNDFENGYSFTEDDANYERYPYQVNWFMAKWTIPGYADK